MNRILEHQSTIYQMNSHQMTDQKIRRKKDELRRTLSSILLVLNGVCEMNANLK